MDITRIFFFPKAWPLGNHQEVTDCKKNLVCTESKEGHFIFSKMFLRLLFTFPSLSLPGVFEFFASLSTPSFCQKVADATWKQHQFGAGVFTKGHLSAATVAV